VSKKYFDISSKVDVAPVLNGARARVTGYVGEKIAQNVAQDLFGQE
jgi:hypothetical protein